MAWIGTHIQIDDASQRTKASVLVPFFDIFYCYTLQIPSKQGTRRWISWGNIHCRNLQTLPPYTNPGMKFGKNKCTYFKWTSMAISILCGPKLDLNLLFQCPMLHAKLPKISPKASRGPNFQRSEPYFVSSHFVWKRQKMQENESKALRASGGNKCFQKRKLPKSPTHWDRLGGWGDPSQNQTIFFRSYIDHRKRRSKMSPKPWPNAAWC
jgi:hypothetical protein